MKASDILKKAGINPDEPVLLITTKDAMENLMEAIKEYCSHLKINKMAKEDIKTLLHGYGDCIKVCFASDENGLSCHMS